MECLAHHGAYQSIWHRNSFVSVTQSCCSRPNQLRFGSTKSIAPLAGNKGVYVSSLHNDFRAKFTLERVATMGFALNLVFSITFTSFWAQQWTRWIGIPAAWEAVHSSWATVVKRTYSRVPTRQLTINRNRLVSQNSSRSRSVSPLPLELKSYKGCQSWISCKTLTPRERNELRWLPISFCGTTLTRCEQFRLRVELKLIRVLLCSTQNGARSCHVRSFLSQYEMRNFFICSEITCATSPLVRVRLVLSTGIFTALLGFIAVLYRR